MSARPVQIRFDQLRRSFDAALRHAEAVHGDAVTLDEDYFWSVPPDQLYDVRQEPTELTIGQLSECLDHLDGLAAEPEDAVGHHLVWLAEVLKAVGLDSP
ncbi:hypothetical protein [Streptomyces luteireticuli]|uniref:Uncharacterized protein n=1 Tax=Streptomyces luteireticuli TaxID=173858 RepID=A0ABN0Z4H1_9ACTN